MGSMRTALAVVLVVATLGCGKKSSKEYFDARRAYDQLVDQEGDDAYLLPEMMQVSNALAAVPERAIEYPMAQKLVATIAAEKARVEKERAELEHIVTAKPLEKQGLPTGEPLPKPPTEPNTAAIDAPPEGGMTEALFKEKFGSCVTGPAPISLQGQGQVPAYTSLNSADCFKRLGITQVAKFFFINGALAGRSTTTTTIIDAGVQVVAPPKPPPAPSGSPTPPAPPPGALIPAGTGDGLKANGEKSDLGARPKP